MKMNQKLLNNKKHWFKSVWPGEIFWRGSKTTHLPPYITYPPQLDHIYAQSFTPLIMATMSGNAMYVKTILSSNEVDLDDECNVIFDGLVVYGATALWVAACLGHLQIVKMLVKNGANVNHNTKAQSSPLRAACYEGRLDIVKYLIEQGANVNLENEYQNTCIMIAAYKGHADVVLTLLKYGAIPNKQALCGSTALHYAAECGNLEVCRLLLDHGATLQQNEQGLSPVLNAAEQTHEEVVDLFIKTPELMTKEEIIIALELLGASFANNKYHYSIPKAFAYLKRAMEMRYSDVDNVIRKRVIPPIAAYDDWFETENLPELQAISQNHHSIHMEALTIRERILGRNYPQLPQSIIHRGAVMADQGRFVQCQKLWNYVIDLRIMNNISVENDLLYFAQLFSQMLRLKDDRLNLSQVLSVLVKCQQDIERNKYKILQPGPKDVPQMLADQNNQNVFSALYLIKILTKVLDQQSQEDKEHKPLLYKTLKKFIKSDTRLVDGQTLLHMAVNGTSAIDDFHTSDVCTFPCFRTALLLVHAGASVLAVDDHHNTPLHTLVANYPRDNPKLLTNADKIVKLLINAGAHLDAVNAKGLTPAQVGHVAVLSNIIQGYGNTLTSLKCIASRCVANNNIKYQGIVPAILESYIEIHSAEKIFA